MRRRRCTPAPYHFSTDEKVLWIFRYLIKELKPELVASVNREEKMKVDGVYHPKIVNYMMCKCETEVLPDKIPYPFEDMIVMIVKRKIFILGPELFYKFPIPLLLMYYSRFKQ